MRSEVITVRALLVLAVTLPFASTGVGAVTPGVDIAFPRVVVCTTNDTTTFNTNAQVVEQGDYVNWKFIGTLLSHTTTSGSACLLPDGLWAATLNTTTPQFMRQFLEDPGAYPYYCSPHCSLGMKGTVTVTAPIALQETFAAGTISLSWTGGGSLYSVLRSANPAFPPASTLTFFPIGGSAGTTFSDTAMPAVGTAQFYLVMNPQP
jgi:plastocyanin